MPVRYDTHFDSEFIQTEKVPRPKPETGPVSVEYNSVEEIPTEATTAVGLSGGNDSLVATHKAMSEGKADFVLHIDTGTNLSATISWVREVCEKFGWPLVIVPTYLNPERWFCRYGAPDAGGHNSAFWALKGRALLKLEKHLDSLTLITGVYQRESQTRMVNVSGEHSSPDYCNWDYWNLLWDWSDHDFEEYTKKHDLPESVTKKTIHRSGDCQCLAYGHRDEIMIDIAANYPDDFAYLSNIETRMQEYRGRLLIIEDRHPEVYQKVKACRKYDGQPYLTLQESMRIFDLWCYEIAKRIPKEDAITRGRQVVSNYLGHGQLSSAEENGLVKNAEVDAGKQADLCEYCGIGNDSEPETVKRAVREAGGQVQ